MRDNLKLLKGLVSEIQRFSVHDGPGIRTIVFLKGCPLQCPWCCNPELQDPLPEIGYLPTKCIGCNSCVSVCSKGALLFNKGVYIDRNLCTRCGLCVEACPSGALRLFGRYLTVQEITEVVLRDEMFYRKSGGGVTVSGGEPLFQSEFLSSLLPFLKNKGLNIALETSGYAEWPILEEILESVDYLLYDLKIFDSQKHEKVIGVSSERIKENLLRSSEKEVLIFLRIPLIPSYTMGEDNIRAIASFVRGVSNVVAIHLLPYHRLGVSKYKQIDRPYPLDGLELPPSEEVRKIAHLFEEEGFRVSIGGG